MYCRRPSRCVSSRSIDVAGTPSPAHGCWTSLLDSPGSCVILARRLPGLTLLRLIFCKSCTCPRWKCGCLNSHVWFSFLILEWIISLTLLNPYTSLFSEYQGVINEKVLEWVLLFSCLTKLCQLLCLKYRGSTFFEKRVRLETRNTSPLSDQPIRSCISGSSTMLFPDDRFSCTGKIRTYLCYACLLVKLTNESCVGSCRQQQLRRRRRVAVRSIILRSSSSSSCSFNSCSMIIGIIASMNDRRAGGRSGDHSTRQWSYTCICKSISRLAYFVRSHWTLTATRWLVRYYFDWIFCSWWWFSHNLDIALPWDFQDQNPFDQF